MSIKCNNQGRAYEYACLKNLETQISNIRPCVLVENSCFHAAQRAWNTLSIEDQLTFQVSS